MGFKAVRLITALLDSYLVMHSVLTVIINRLSGACRAFTGFMMVASLLPTGTSAGLNSLPLELMFDLQRLDSYAISPDGSRVAYILAQSDPLAGADGPVVSMVQSIATKLYVLEMRTGVSELVDIQGKKVFGPAWSPDSTSLAFRVGVDDEARLYVWSSTTREARKLCDATVRNFLSPALWTPDSRSIVIAVLAEGDSSDAIARRAGFKTPGEVGYPLDRSVAGARVAVYENSSEVKQSQATPLSSRQDFATNQHFTADLAVVDVATGRMRRLATGHRPTYYRLSPDGMQVAFTDLVGQARGSAYQNLFDLRVAALDAPGLRTLARDVSQAGSTMDVRWSPDGRLLAYSESGPSSAGDVFVVSSSDGRTKKLSSVLPKEGLGYQQVMWSEELGGLYVIRSAGMWRISLADGTWRPIAVPPGKRIQGVITTEPTGLPVMNPSGGRSLFVRTQDRATKLEGVYLVEPDTDNWHRICEEEASIGEIITTAAKDLFLYSSESAHACPQLWVSDPAFERPRKVTAINPGLDRIQLGHSRLVEWSGLDGRPTRGALLLPSDWRPGKPVPLITWLYGGEPLSGLLHRFGFIDKGATMPYLNKQLFATRGYAVLMADTEARVGTPMRDICASLLPGIDKLVAEGVADPQRLGLIGWSYGGYSVLSVIAQTTRFKAAVDGAGASSIFGGYFALPPDGHAGFRISWAEESQGRMGDTLWNRRDRYIENSPFFYLDRITTPLLIIQGTDDIATYPFESDAVFQALRRLGKPVVYAKYLGEGHAILGRANASDFLSRLVGWFDQHLQPNSGK